MNILSLIKEIIDEKNDNDGCNFVLSQPHEGDYLKKYSFQGKSDKDKNLTSFSTSIIRESSNLPLKKKISIFKKFEQIIQGGIVFNSHISQYDTTVKEHLSSLVESKVKAFSIN